jgi:hypothetical protein
LGLFGIELNAIQFGDTVHDGGYFTTELSLDIIQSYLGVFNGIMKEGCHHGDLVQANISHDLGNGQWMIDIALTTSAGLQRVSRSGRRKGFCHEQG